MPLLVLDLDETVVVTPQRRQLIHQAHILSPRSYQSLVANRHGQLGYVHFYIINPEQIARLIEYACKNYNGILILTSGLWLPSIRNELANNLDLSINAHRLLENCYFHSAYTDSIVFNLPVGQLQKLNKNERLQRIIESRLELAGKYFTVVDDNFCHIDSFKNNRKVKAVLATTSQNDLSFYKHAEEAMTECWQHEYNAMNLIQHGMFREHQNTVTDLGIEQENSSNVLALKKKM